MTGRPRPVTVTVAAARAPGTGSSGYWRRPQPDSECVTSSRLVTYRPGGPQAQAIASHGEYGAERTLHDIDFKINSLGTVLHRPHL